MELIEDRFELLLATFRRAVGITALIVLAVVLVGWIELIILSARGFSGVPIAGIPPVAIWWFGLLALKLLAWILIIIWLVCTLWLRDLRFHQHINRGSQRA